MTAAPTAPVPSQVHSALQARHEPYFVQQVPVGSELVGRSRLDVLAALLAGKRVLHVGYADWPITDLGTNLHVALDRVCAQLDGVDPHDEAAEALRPHVSGRLLTSLDQVSDSYDVVLVPEVLEHVGDAQAFLAELDALDFETVLITVPDAYSCAGGHFDHNARTGMFVEVVHPDHNYWFTPYTLQNIVAKYTSWQVDGLWFFNGISLLLMASKRPRATPVPLPSPDEAVRCARADELAARVLLAETSAPVRALLPGDGPATSLPHVCYLMPRTDVGGGARVILEHAARLTAAGCEVTLLSHFPEPDWHPVGGTFVRVPFGVDLAEAVPLCDVVVAGYWDQVLAARRTGIAPVVHLEQGDEHLFEELPPEREALVQACVAAADRTLTLSAGNARILQERYATCAQVVPNAVDPRVFRLPAEAPAPVGTSAPYLLLVGWDGNAFKGIAQAYEAWRVLQAQGRRLDLVWVTPKPPLVPRGRVVVAPAQHELARLYAGAAAHLHASHYESFPLPPMEAMACGAPVVATANTGVLEYAQDGHNALVVPVGDVVAMAAAVGRLLDDPGLAQRCRAGGLTTAARFSWPAITEQLLTVYREVAELRPADGPDRGWRRRLDGLTASAADQRRLRLRLAATPHRQLAVPVSWPAFDGHRVVRWQVVAERDQGLPGADRAYLPHTAGTAPIDLPYAGALEHLRAGRPQQALAGFCGVHADSGSAAERAALGRWVALCLLECGQDEQALEVAVAGAASHPGYADYAYLAVVTGRLLGRDVDVPRARSVAELLGPASRADEWFEDVPGLLARQAG